MQAMIAETGDGQHSDDEIMLWAESERHNKLNQI